MRKTIIATDKAPRAIGAYNQAVSVEGGKLLFVSGQLGMDPGTMELVSGGVSAEAVQAMKNLEAILVEAGGGFESIVKATIYLADIKDFTAVNEIYASCFASDFPARAAFAVADLPKAGRVEIEAVAAL
ncbi:MAG: Rid family detoxifying hydrolase [candidate division Zixibacteria bacterium]|nr:Rid family detoxifying hydrolase [candidate division Zixibacteria bacterium]